MSLSLFGAYRVLKGDGPLEDPYAKPECNSFLVLVVMVLSSSSLSSCSSSEYFNWKLLLNYEEWSSKDSRSLAWSDFLLKPERIFYLSVWMN